jgi:hypothetical protein
MRLQESEQEGQPYGCLPLKFSALARNFMGWSGASQNTRPTMAATPAMWTMTLVLFNRATRRTRSD